jgi:hypothetical protein
MRFNDPAFIPNKWNDLIYHEALWMLCHGKFNPLLGESPIIFGGMLLVKKRHDYHRFATWLQGIVNIVQSKMNLFDMLQNHDAESHVVFLGELRFAAFAVYAHIEHNIRVYGIFGVLIDSGECAILVLKVFADWPSSSTPINDIQAFDFYGLQVFGDLFPVRFGVHFFAPGGITMFLMVTATMFTKTTNQGI